jgi:phosphate transport system substrate-binding protein
MKKIAMIPFFLVTSVAALAHADSETLKGSDTLFAPLTDAIHQLGLDAELHYAGGGSGQGEAALLAGAQGLAPMSKPISAQALQTAASDQLTITENVVGLDGVAVFVKSSEPALQISLSVLRSIFGGEDGSGSAAACAAATRVLDWSAVPGSGKTGAIQAFRRNDDSGTTDTFKHLVGLKGFCADVAVLSTTSEIAQETSTNPAAIGYAGLSGERAGSNRALAVGKDEAGPFVAPSVGTIRDFSYPLSRRLYIYVVGGTRVPSAAEKTLLDAVLHRSFFDPILVANDFVACAPTGCP